MHSSTSQLLTLQARACRRGRTSRCTPLPAHCTCMYERACPHCYTLSLSLFTHDMSDAAPRYLTVCTERHRHDLCKRKLLPTRYPSCRPELGSLLKCAGLNVTAPPIAKETYDLPYGLIVQACAIKGCHAFTVANDGSTGTLYIFSPTTNATRDGYLILPPAATG